MAKAKSADALSDDVVQSLQKLYSHELSGVVRYLHYSHMIMGPNRIPIVSWLKEQATEAQTHAYEVGEKLTAFHRHPEMKVTPVAESGKHNVLDVLREALDYEREGLAEYLRLLGLVREHRPGDAALEDWVRKFVADETQHLESAEKMLRTM
jgi:bacterioferritin